MEPKKEMLIDNYSIVNYLGDLIDFKSDSNYEEKDIENINVEKEDFVESISIKS